MKLFQRPILVACLVGVSAIGFYYYSELGIVAFSGMRLPSNTGIEKGTGTRREEVPQKDGKNHGLGKYWHGNGQLYGEIPWKEGEKHGTFTLYREDGSVESTFTYHEGKLHGIQKWFHPNNSLKDICSYRDGTPIGTMRTYHENGLLSRAQHFQSGIPFGVLIDFNNVGQLEHFAFMQGDKVLLEREFEAPAPDTGVPGVIYKQYYAGFPAYGALLTSIEKIPIEKWRQVAVKKEVRQIAADLAPFPAQDLRIHIEKTSEANLLFLVNEANVQFDTYLSFVVVNLAGGDYPFSFHGPYLMGKVVPEKKGNWVWPDERLYLRYQSCTECSPFVYLHAISFAKVSLGTPYLFSYEKKFGMGLEIVLPGHGHSPDGVVETRFLKVPEGEFYLQSFRLGYEDEKSGKLTRVYHEFWPFKCEGTLCRASLFKEKIPTQFKQLWKKAAKLIIEN